MGALFGSLTALSIGLSDLFGRHVVNRRGPVIASVVVQAVSIVASAITLAFVSSELIGIDLLIGLVSGLGLGIGLWGYLSGLGVSSSAVVSPIVATMSAVFPYAYAIVRGADATGWSLVGALVALVGLILVSFGGGPIANIAAGVRWSVISGFGYGFGLSIIMEASESSGAWPAVTQRVAALGLMVMVASRTGTGFALLGVRAAGIAAGVFAAASTIFYLLGVQADATPAVVTASMFPAVTVMVGRLAYRDSVSGMQLIGIVVALAGIAGVVAL